MEIFKSEHGITVNELVAILIGMPPNAQIQIQDYNYLGDVRNDPATEVVLNEEKNEVIIR